MAQEKKQETAKFVYVFGDANKTPVDFNAQPVGTRCVLVTPGGQEYEVFVGTSKVVGEITPEEQAKLDRMKSWDPTNAKFPNLKISREG